MKTEWTPPLSEVGTRYKHISELIDLWSDGVEIVKKSYNSFPNAKDKLRLAKLEAAVALLKSHLENLAKYDDKQWSLREEINRIPRLKTEPRAEELQKEKEESPATEAAVKDNFGASTTSNEEDSQDFAST